MEEILSSVGATTSWHKDQTTRISMQWPRSFDKNATVQAGVALNHIIWDRTEFTEPCLHFNAIYVKWNGSYKYHSTSTASTALRKVNLLDVYKETFLWICWAWTESTQNSNRYSEQAWLLTTFFMFFHTRCLFFCTRYDIFEVLILWQEYTYVVLYPF